MGAIFKVVLAENAAGTTNPYELPPDTFVPSPGKRKKTSVKQIPGMSGGIDTADGKLAPGVLDVTMQIDDDDPVDVKTLRQLLWTKFHAYAGMYIVVFDMLADPDEVMDAWLYDDINHMVESRVRRMQMRATRLKIQLSLNTQPYEEGGDIPV